MLDLGFVIEASASVERHGRGNFKRLLQFVADVVRKFPISPTRTRVGVVTFGAKSDLLFGFERYSPSFTLLDIHWFVCSLILSLTGMQPSQTSNPRVAQQACLLHSVKYCPQMHVSHGLPPEFARSFLLTRNGAVTPLKRLFNKVQGALPISWA